MADGCFAGDPAGLPVEITAPGPFSTAFFVRADNVPLDLKGVEIRGTNTCSHSKGTLSCAQFGLGYGVFTDPGVVRTAVRKGSVVENISGFGTSISDSVVKLNGTNLSFQGVGLQLVDFVSYSGDTVTGNDFNQVVGGVNRGGNYCVGTGTASQDCP